MAKKKTVPARSRPPKPANARRTPPPRAAHPQPTSTAGLIAPDEQAEVQRTIDEHPEIDTMDEEERGEIIDITARRLNPGGGEKPWGRKARNNDPNNPNLNTDGMTFLRPDGRFEIYDCISGIDGQATWDGYGPYAPGENGYWWPPAEVEGGESGGGEEGGGALDARIVALETAVADLQAQASGFEARIASLESLAAQPFRCHGPVDLPIIVESLTRMRAKGDIDVAVSQGEAVPPTPSDDTWDLLDTALLKRLLDRLRGDGTAPETAGASLSGTVVLLQAKATGKFVRADLNQSHAPLAANSTDQTAWEEFVMIVR